MGLIKWFSSSTNDMPSRRVKDHIENLPPGNPNPHNYIVENGFNVNNHCVLIIRYPDADNYEGRKILVYKNMSRMDVIKHSKIDPHFAETGLSPFARFEPTSDGLKAAKMLAENL